MPKQDKANTTNVFRDKNSRREKFSRRLTSRKPTFNIIRKPKGV